MEELTADTERPRIIFVEFGQLTEDQTLFIDLHHLRAVGAEHAPPEGGGYVAGFTLRDGEDPTAVYDEVRGWALGHGLPIRRLLTE